MSKRYPIPKRIFLDQNLLDRFNEVCSTQEPNKEVMARCFFEAGLSVIESAIKEGRTITYHSSPINRDLRIEFEREVDND